MPSVLMYATESGYGQFAIQNDACCTYGSTKIIASFSAIFVRNIMPVSYSTGDLAISVINSSAPSHTLMVCNFGCAFVGKPGIATNVDAALAVAATVTGAVPVAGPELPGAAAEGLPQPPRTATAGSNPINRNLFIA